MVLASDQYIRHLAGNNVKMMGNNCANIRISHIKGPKEGHFTKIVKTDGQLSNPN